MPNYRSKMGQATRFISSEKFQPQACSSSISPDGRQRTKILSEVWRHFGSIGAIFPEKRTRGGRNERFFGSNYGDGFDFVWVMGLRQILYFDGRRRGGNRSHGAAKSARNKPGPLAPGRPEAGDRKGCGIA